MFGKLSFQFVFALIFLPCWVMLVKLFLDCNISFSLSDNSFFLLLGIINYICRSEVHEKMNCIRCQNSNDTNRSIAEGDANQPTNESGQSGHEISDIGGFAEMSGCLHELKSSEKQVGHIFLWDVIDSLSLLTCKLISLFFLFQVGTPLEEDLSNWGHHFFPNSVPDAILQASAGAEVWEEKNLTVFLFN